MKAVAPGNLAAILVLCLVLEGCSSGVSHGDAVKTMDQDKWGPVIYRAEDHAPSAGRPTIVRLDVPSDYVNVSVACFGTGSASYTGIVGSDVPALIWSKVPPVGLDAPLTVGFGAGLQTCTGASFDSYGNTGRIGAFALAVATTAHVRWSVVVSIGRHPGAD